MTDNFYRKFEDRFRGSRDLIRSRLQVYRPFLDPLFDPLLAAASTPRALDLGCGRGEWLELLGEWGFGAHGVDCDEGMLAACRALDLDVERGEALEVLRRTATASCAVVSAFHVVEHIPFEALRLWVAEARRVLIPGGLMILETPNPDNLAVASHYFYLDPTHQRPLPAALLAFVAEHAGFLRVKTLGLQETPELSGKEEVSLFEVFHGASPDYAIVAQKRASAEALARFDGVFAREYGLTQAELLRRRDAMDVNARTLIALMERTNSEGAAHLRQALETLRQAQAETALMAEQARATAQREHEAARRAQEAEAAVQQALAENRALTAEAAARLAVAESRAQVAEAQAEKAVAEAQAARSAAESRAQVVEAQAEKAVAEAQAARSAAESRAQVAEAAARQTEADSRAKLEQMETRWVAAGRELEQAQRAIHDQWQQAQLQQQTIEALRSSWSWRVTGPLRWLSAPLLNRRRSDPAQGVAASVSARLIRWGMARPGWVSAVHAVVDHVPPLRDAITRRVARAMHPPLRLTPVEGALAQHASASSGSWPDGKTQIHARPLDHAAYRSTVRASPLSEHEIMERIRGELNDAHADR